MKIAQSHLRKTSLSDRAAFACDECPSGGKGYDGSQILIDGTGSVTNFGREKIGSEFPIAVQGPADLEAKLDPRLPTKCIFAIAYSNDTQKTETIYHDNISEGTDTVTSACNQGFKIKDETTAG